MRIINAMMAKAGAKTEVNKMLGMTQPIQFLTAKEKDDNWIEQNFLWCENKGIQQIKRNAKKLLKNYNLAAGIIEKTDYIPAEDNDYTDLVEKVLTVDDSALQLKFYPIIPTVVNTFVNEFSKRVNKISFVSVDELSHIEKFESKKGEVGEVLLQKAQFKIYQKLLNAGVQPDSEEFQQQMAPESIKSLPEIENFYKKSYQNIYEEWATHQTRVDEERFYLQELEERAFKDSLITDREFWHFKMMEDDYEVELWNPLQVFYHKSPGQRYISQSSWVGMIDLMTPADVVDKYGWMMTDDQFKSLEMYYPIKAAGYLLPGMQNDGSYYDGTRSHSWNTEGPSLAYRQMMSRIDNFQNSGDTIQWLLSESEDTQDFGNIGLLRVTTLYWKTQRLMYELTKITEAGETIKDTVSEEYKVTEKPMYDTTFYKTKTKDNLIYGEHLDPIWVNEWWGGIRIGPNRPTYWANTDSTDMQPMYLGMAGKKPGRIPFQFKGDYSLVGCKPPVEGAVFSDRNTKSRSLVDTLAPYQIGHNILMNQIIDISIDELGKVVILDQNALPKISMGEDWGKNNLLTAHTAMKMFKILPTDHSLDNLGGAPAFNNYTALDLSQSQQLVAKMQLAMFFKQQAMEMIGLTPERLGQQMSRQSAAGVEMAVNASYVQTEQYFTQHCKYLMPRVHQMRTELAQYYQSTNPSIRLQYAINEDEKVTFTLDGTKLLSRDLNVFVTTKTNTQAIADRLKEFVLNNNTSGASFTDVGNIIKADTISEIDRILKTAEERTERQRREEMEQAQKQHEEELAAEQQQLQMKLQFEAEEKAKDRQNEVLIAEIKAAGYGSMVDLNENQQSDFQDAMEGIRKEQQYQDTMNFKREQESNKITQSEQKMDLDRQKLQAQRDIAEKQLQVAKENKNKYDVKKPKK